MIIAIPVSEELIFEHFGHSERFWLYDLQNGEVVSRRELNASGSGHEALASLLRDNAVDTLICGGIGSGAVNALRSAGIEIYGGIRGLADAAVEALSRGILVRSGEANCSAHEEGMGCGCSHHEEGMGCGCSHHEEGGCGCSHHGS